MDPFGDKLRRGQLPPALRKLSVDSSHRPTRVSGICIEQHNPQAAAQRSPGSTRLIAARDASLWQRKKASTPKRVPPIRGGILRRRGSLKRAGTFERRLQGASERKSASLPSRVARAPASQARRSRATHGRAPKSLRSIAAVERSKSSLAEDKVAARQRRRRVRFGRRRSAPNPPSAARRRIPPRKKPPLPSQRARTVDERDEAVRALQARQAEEVNATLADLQTVEISIFKELRRCGAAVRRGDRLLAGGADTPAASSGSESGAEEESEDLRSSGPGLRANQSVRRRVDGGAVDAATAEDSTPAEEKKTVVVTRAMTEQRDRFRTPQKVRLMTASETDCPPLGRGGWGGVGNWDEMDGGGSDADESVILTHRERFNELFRDEPAQEDSGADRWRGARRAQADDSESNSEGGFSQVGGSAPKDLRM